MGIPWIHPQTSGLGNTSPEQSPGDLQPGAPGQAGEAAMSFLRALAGARTLAQFRGQRSQRGLVKADRQLLNNKVPVSNNTDNTRLRTGYKLFSVHPGGRQPSRQNPGAVGARKQDVMASAVRY